MYVFEPIGKTIWLSRPLIGWNMFDFSSQTTKRNSTKLDREQDLSVLYQVFVFKIEQYTKWPPWSFCQKGGTLYPGSRYVGLLFNIGTVYYCHIRQNCTFDTTVLHTAITQQNVSSATCMSVGMMICALKLYGGYKQKRENAAVWQIPLNERQCIGEVIQRRYKYVRLHYYYGPTYGGQLERQQSSNRYG